MLVLKLNLDHLTDHNDISKVFDDFFKEYKLKICEHISSVHNIDPFKFEGGVESWFGLGSVMLYSLNLQPTIKWNEDEVELTLS